MAGDGAGTPAVAQVVAEASDVVPRQVAPARWQHEAEESRRLRGRQDHSLARVQLEAAGPPDSIGAVSRFLVRAA